MKDKKRKKNNRIIYVQEETFEKLIKVQAELMLKRKERVVQNDVLDYLINKYNLLNLKWNTNAQEKNVVMNGKHE